MAKVISPFKIQGTLDDLNFIVTADGNNYVRMKGKTGITSEEFNNNPIFDRIRNQGKEMGYCSKKAKTFRLLVKHFFDQAKEGSFAGRVNGLFLEILEEDKIYPKGQRTLEAAFDSTESTELLLNFEANKTRPLHKVLKTNWRQEEETNTLTMPNFNPTQHIDWPEQEATHLHISIATATWDYSNDQFDTCYSEEIIVEKTAETTTLTLVTATPKPHLLTLTFLFIGFSVKERKKIKMLHRKYNTATLILVRSEE